MTTWRKKNYNYTKRLWDIYHKAYMSKRFSSVLLAPRKLLEKIDMFSKNNGTGMEKEVTITDIEMIS